MSKRKERLERILQTADETYGEQVELKDLYTPVKSEESDLLDVAGEAIDDSDKESVETENFSSFIILVVSIIGIAGLGAAVYLVLKLLGGS